MYKPEKVRKRRTEFYEIPDDCSTKTAVIMVMFKRVPKGEEEVRQYKKNIRKAPGYDKVADSWTKKFFGSIQDKVLANHKYMHCEIAFNRSMYVGGSGDKSKAIAYYVSAVDKEGKPGYVDFMERTFMSTYYSDYIVLRAPRERVFKTAKYCKKQLGKPFDENGSKGIYSIAEEFDGSKFFCVSLVLAALQHGRIIRGYDPLRTTVDKLYDILKEHRWRDKRALLPYQDERLKSVSSSSMDICELVVSQYGKEKTRFLSTPTDIPHTRKGSGSSAHCRDKERKPRRRRHPTASRRREKTKTAKDKNDFTYEVVIGLLNNK